MHEGATLEDRLRDSGSDTPGEYRRIESLCRITSQPAADCELRQHVCGRHPDLRARHMQERLELANVRSLLDELRRQTQRQALRQPEVREIEIRADILARKVTGEKPEQIPLDLELLVQWWQRRLGLRQGCLLRHHIGLRSAAEIEFVLNDNELIALIVDQPECCCDPTT